MDTGRYDFDLAEFPLFRYSKNDRNTASREPLVYADTITGRDGARIERHWEVYPGPFGFGGQTTQQVLYELLQLYIEQGCRGTQIQFGTPRALLLRTWPEARNPSTKDYARLRRDLDILRGYDFHCRNAFWDRKRQAYVDMHWRLFGDVCYFKPRPNNSWQEELPFGFIEVSRVLQQIARTRGFFSLGFNSDLFHSLKPLEQRLALYLSKKFVSQARHQRYVADLARALPIEAARPDNLRATIARAADGLLTRGVPTLRAYSFEKSARTGEWLVVFERRTKPTQSYRLPRHAALSLDPEVALLVQEITARVGSRDDVLWWTKCAEALGADLVQQGLSQLRDAEEGGVRVRSRGALLTKIFKDLAARHQSALQ
ncbi:MAG: hypothetical protein IT293_01685 [Deltaproteobacteria bacterium]|nr:hypothetical protein [Deltaproteobacteria bacterium]